MRLYYVEPLKTPRWFDPWGFIIGESVPEMILYKTLETTKYVGAIVICSAQNQFVSLHFQFLSVVLSLCYVSVF